MAAPKRTGSSAGSPVSAAASSIDPSQSSSTLSQSSIPPGDTVVTVSSQSVASPTYPAGAAQLTRMNHKARPDKYQSPRDYAAANFASRTMRWTGVIVGLFLIFHLLDLTWGTANPDFHRGDVYDNVIASFERVPVAIVYIAANIALGIHIFHGAWSMFQSLGWNSPRYNSWRRAFAVAFAAVITVGNVSMPLLVVTGVVN